MSSHRSESAELQRCFSHVAHPGSIEDRGGTLLNPPCNSSHKMRSNAPQRETNIWGVLHYKREIAETQSLEVLERGERGDGERVAQEEKWLIPERGSTAIDLSSQI